MLKIEKTQVVGWEAAIRGMRNPYDSWEKSDSLFIGFDFCDEKEEMQLALTCGGKAPILKENDLTLMKKLAKAGSVHGKFMRMLIVTADITAPLYWWKEYDTYKVGTVANSCSTMHTITKKHLTMEDFSTDHLNNSSKFILQGNIDFMNAHIDAYNAHPENEKARKEIWWQIIKLLPESYNQKRTLMLNYSVLANIYHYRKDHRLDEWHTFCDWIEKLPYSELITGKDTASDG